MIKGCIRPNPRRGDICVRIPGSSVTQGLQRFSEEQQINVLLFINLSLFSSFSLHQSAFSLVIF